MSIIRNAFLCRVRPFQFSGEWACFTSVNNARGSNWRDDIRRDGDGTSAMCNRANETMREGTDKAKNQAGDMTGSVVDMAKQGVVKAMETGIDIGEKVKQTMNVALDAAKETTKTVKDKVVGGKEGDAWEAAKETTKIVEDKVVGGEEGDGAHGKDYEPADSRLEKLRKRT